MRHSPLNLLRFLRKYLLRRTHSRDLKRLNRAADQLNAEAADVLDYQNMTPESLPGDFR